MEPAPFGQSAQIPEERTYLICYLRILFKKSHLANIQTINYDVKA
jgi:hypothetical protein